MTQSQATDRESLLAIFFKRKFLKHYELAKHITRIVTQRNQLTSIIFLFFIIKSIRISEKTVPFRALTVKS